MFTLPISRAALSKAAAVVACTGMVAGCSVGGTSDTTTGEESPTEVVVATHESWAMSKDVLREFTEQTGYRVKVEPTGDAGELTNRLVLTKNSPIGDVVYGIDNTFASRAVDEGVLADYTAQDLPASAERFALPDEEAAARLTPIDYGDVCVNVDDVWFEKQNLEPPASLDDLTDPRYHDLFVTPGATTSSPGLAFLLATIAEYGEDGWQGYWEDLMANGTKVTAGWSDAYQVDFTAGGGGGDRPIVLSYASSPPFTIPEGGTRPTTSALLDTCFRQIEYAGVIEGAANPEGAKAFVDFMLGQRFQEALPDNMYVFPVDDQVALPAVWAKWAKTPEQPLSVDPQDIAENRDEWLRTWGDVTTR